MPTQRAVIELIRHGEPVGGSRIRGSLDDPLSDTGWTQMRGALAEREGWSRIVTSPLRRCAEFAGQVAARDATPLHVEPALAEIHFGDWEGRTPDELYASDNERVRRFFADPVSHPPPGGESFEAFQARVAGAWGEIVREADGRWLVVAHGGTIRVILAAVLGIPLSNIFSLQVEYASVSQVVTYAGAGDEAHPARVVLRSHA